MDNGHRKELTRICFFGASVTAQESGYAKVLTDRWKGCNDFIFGYGGMHLNDAGVCYIDNVLEKNPNICFVDWFSTDYNKCDEKTIEYLDTIVYKFTKAKCKLIFLFMRYRNNPKKREFYDFCKKYLADRKLSYIDVFEETKDIPIDEILRDNIHTTENGSNIYANIIERCYQNIKEDAILPQNVKKTLYTEIKHINIEREFKSKLILKGKCEIIGIYLLVGKHSGIVYITEKDKTVTTNIWDKWCYYNRDHFRMNMVVDGIVSIIISNETFDTSICKVPIDVAKVKKKLVVHSIYYVGDELSVVNIKEGKKICQLRYKAPIWYRKKRDGIVKIIKRVIER